MRLRRKPWARPELAASPFFMDQPKDLRGRWQESFAQKQPLYLELGCGKGSFLAQLAPKNPQNNYLGVDIKSEVLVLAKRNAERSYEAAGLPLENLLLTAQNIELIDEILSPQDVVERIYINFCNPWPRPKHNKRRLTHPRQLKKYQTFLRPGGEIHFKTDDDGLFEDSIRYFQECGFAITYLTRDLHQSDWQGNILTEHENMFSQEGIPIKFLVARFDPLAEAQAPQDTATVAQA